MLVLCSLAAAIRIALLLTSLKSIEADEAVVGLMAKHILEGERPVFDYGLAYHGTLEKYLTAGVFAIFGASDFTLRLVPVLYSVLLVVAIYKLATLVYDRQVGLISATYVAIAPAFLITWGLKAGSGYIEILLLGSVALLFGIRILYGRISGIRDYSILGLLLGLSFWTHPIAVCYGISLVLAGLAKIPGAALRLFQQPSFSTQRVLSARWLVTVARGGSKLVSLLLGFLVGASPALWFNLDNDFATFQALSQGSTSLSTALESLKAVLCTSLPILTGFIQASTADELFQQHLDSRQLLRWIGTALPLGMVLAVLWARYATNLTRHPRTTCEEHTKGETPLLIHLLVVPTMFAFSSFSFLIAEPRYLLPLYSTVPLFGSLVWFRWRNMILRYLSVLFFAFLVVINVYGVTTIDPRLNLPYVSGKSLPLSHGPLIDFLTEHNIDAVYADYWIATLIAFESNERVVGSVIRAENRIGWNRYPRHAIMAEASLRPAYVFIDGSPEDSLFAATLERDVISFQKKSIDVYAIYYALDRRIRFEP